MHAVRMVDAYNMTCVSVTGTTLRMTALNGFANSDSLMVSVIFFLSKLLLIVRILHIQLTLRKET